MVCERWDWRSSARPLEKCNLDGLFFEGHFLKVLFDRMGRILDQVSLTPPSPGCSPGLLLYHSTCFVELQVVLGQQVCNVEVCVCVCVSSPTT